MDTSHELNEFVLEWACYLTQKRHHVRLVRVSPPVLRSDAEDGSYRWLLFHAARPSHRLTAVEREHAVRERAQARTTGQQAYVVIKFTTPLSKVVALPAATALALGTISADKGGIPWEE